MILELAIEEDFLWPAVLFVVDDVPAAPAPDVLFTDKLFMPINKNGCIE